MWDETKFFVEKEDAFQEIQKQKTPNMLTQKPKPSVFQKFKKVIGMNFLHIHHFMQEEHNVPTDHVIVDRKDYEQTIHLLRNDKYFHDRLNADPIKPENSIVDALVFASVGSREQSNLIEEFMKDYFERFPSYKDKLNHLEWYHLFLDFLDNLNDKDLTK